jgi:hypothetical protein
MNYKIKRFKKAYTELDINEINKFLKEIGNNLVSVETSQGEDNDYTTYVIVYKDMSEHLVDVREFNDLSSMNKFIKDIGNNYISHNITSQNKSLYHNKFFVSYYKRITKNETKQNIEDVLG